MAKKQPHGFDGSIAGVLHRQLNGSELLLNNLDQPLLALAAYCQQVLAPNYHLVELVREADLEWGRRMDERPHSTEKVLHRTQTTPVRSLPFARH